MGYGSYVRHDYVQREATRASTGRRMAHTTDIREGRMTAMTHPQMNPYGALRESRDSAAHPESLAIGVMFDVTGSMGMIPPLLQARCANLMSMLVDRGYVPHPQVLFGGVGDATSDRGPLQAGQFESNVTMDEDLERLWLEGGGGGTKHESYELAHYFFARCTVTDCWEKRQAKGYLFTIGDEMPYARVSRRFIQNLIGGGAEADVATVDIVRECQEKWHVFHLIAETPTSADPAVGQAWEQLLPEGHVLRMARPDNAAEMIAMVIGINEGRVDMDEARQALGQMGVDGVALTAVMDSLRPLASIRGIRLHA